MTVSEMKKAIADFSYDFGELPEFHTKYPIPEIVPNTGHPRVWINKETLPRVRKSKDHPENANNLAKVMVKADKDIDGKLPPVAEGARTNFTHEVISDIECMAYMYLATGDEKYGYKAIMCAKNWLSTIDFPKPNDNWEFYVFSNHSGYSIHVMAEVYDWCYDLMTDKDKVDLGKGTANTLGPNLEVKYPPNAMGGVTGHGLGAQMLRDWLSFAIATYEEYPQFYNCVVGRILGEYVEAPNFYYASGANFQGSAYGINKTYLHMVSEILMKVATGTKIYNPDVSFEATVATYMHYHRPDGESLRLGDDYNQRNRPYALGDSIRLAFFGGVYYGNAALKAWSSAMSSGFTRLGWGGRCEINPVIFLVMNDTSLGATEKDQYSLPLINYNGKPYGAMTTRSAWDDKNAWMTYCKIGEIYGANHDHKDAGTFQVYYKGILAQNSSCYEYRGREQYGSDLDFGYNKQTISKNGLLVYNPDFPEADNKWDAKWLNSGGQRFRGNDNGENSSLTEWKSKPSSHQAKILAHDYKYDDNGEVLYSYIAGDISNAYYENTVRSITRQMISVATGNEAHPLVFMTYDRLSSVKPEYKKTYLLHTPTEPKIEGNVISFDNKPDTLDEHLKYLPEDNNGKLVNTVLLPKNADINVIGGDGKRFFVNGKNLADEWRDPDTALIARQEIGWGRIEVSPKDDNVSDTFFNVMYVGDADKDDAYVAPTVIESATHDGAIIFGKAVLFPKCDRAAAFDVSFKLDCPAYCIVTGLEAGKWQVCVNGVPVETVNVTADAQLAAFDAFAGDVTVKKA